MEPRGTFAKTPELLPAGSVSRGKEVVRGAAQDAILVRLDPGEIDQFIGKTGLQLILVNISFLNKRFQIDQQRIPGKCGITGIGRISETGGAERKDLPERLAGAGEEIYEPAGFGPE
jgi:hypothetical protein